MEKFRGCGVNTYARRCMRNRSQRILNPSSILCSPHGQSWQTIVGTFMETPTHFDILPLSRGCVIAWAFRWRWAEDGAALLSQAWLGADGIVVEPCREVLQSLASHCKRGKGQFKRLPWAMSVWACAWPQPVKNAEVTEFCWLHLNLIDSTQGETNHFSLAHSSQAITLSFDGTYFYFTCQMQI